MSKKLRILEVCNLDRFAASPYMLPFFRELVNRGHEVHVACKVTTFAETLEEAGLIVHDLPITRSITPVSDLKAYFRLKSLVREGAFDIVHTHNPKDGVLGRAAAWKLGVSTVIHTCNGFYFSHRSSGLRKRLVLMAERFAGRRCHLMIFVNTDDLALAAAKKVVAPTKAKLIYNGVDPERFRPGDDGGLRAELGIPPEAVVIGYIGEIRREKNLDTLAEAVASLLPSHPQLCLVLVGDYSIEPQYPGVLSSLFTRLASRSEVASSPRSGAAPRSGVVSSLFPRFASRWRSSIPRETEETEHAPQGPSPSPTDTAPAPSGSGPETPLCDQFPGPTPQDDTAGMPQDQKVTRQDGNMRTDGDRALTGDGGDAGLEDAGTGPQGNGAAAMPPNHDGLSVEGEDKPVGQGDLFANRLFFTGYRFDPERFYRMFDIYVLPSTREGFGVTLIEAMASGVPVIACDVRGPREIVEDGRDGILVPDRDPVALADAISFYLQAPQAVENYTRRARRKVEREFDHARMRAQLLQAYQA
ncbi:MAG: glycosyltransferase [Actinobacteria bacterium]|nr:glycosyltransferase [Actinomycetota bacterium]